MAERKMQVRLPRLAMPSVFSDGLNSILTADRETVLTYDPATRSGFVYAIRREFWSISAPIEFSEFYALLLHAGYELLAGEDAQRWLRACGGSAARAH